MLDTPASGKNIDLSDISGKQLLVLRDVMDHGELLESIKLDVALLELCEKFEMLACARSIMRSTAIPRLATTKDTQARGPEIRTVTTTRGTSHLAMDRLLLFRWASKLDCVDIGIRLPSSMGGSDPRTVHRNMPGCKSFRSNQARSLDPAWAFAISAGQCAAKGMEEGDTGYWPTVAAVFRRAFDD